MAVAIKDRLAAVPPAGSSIKEVEALNAFYAGRDYRSVWFGTSGPTRAARQTLAELERADTWGLDPSDFKLPETSTVSFGSARSPDETAQAELELARAIIRYARHARGGRIAEPERMLSDYLDRRPQMPEPLAVLERIAASAEPAAALTSYHPQHAGFRRLRDLFAKQYAGQKKGDVVDIAEDGPLLVPGQSNDEVALLRRRLGLPASGDERLYDETLKVAVKEFQKSASLTADGYIGKRTRKALNTRGGDKRDAFIASMEQWRWLPEDLGSSHLFVNIPAFTVDIVQNGSVKLSEAVIVGKPETPTPVFSKNMTSIVLRPSWFLPDSIKQEKLLSAQRRGSSLESEGIIVKKGKRTIESWTVDWANADLSKYAIYQPSGDGNALGSVKFLFPNKHSVYLHDTPMKSLFTAEERLFSHGCVRLRNPQKVAQTILDADKGEGVIDVTWSVKKGEDNKEVTLTEPLPVHIAYFTVTVDENGEAEFHGDPYGHDERIRLALAGQWDKIDKGPGHDTLPDAGLASVKIAAPAKSASPARSEVASNPVGAARARTWSPPAGLFNASIAPANAPAPKKAKKAVGYVGELMNSAFAR